MNQIEMRVNEIQLPPPIVWNRSEVTEWLTGILSQYENLVYTDDQIKEAKADKAKLNKIRKAMNDERIRYQKEYMASFEQFKAEVDETIKMIDSATARISMQIEEAEAKRRDEKASAINVYWWTLDKPKWLDLGNIFRDKWLNASYSMKQVEEDLKENLNRIKADITAIEALPEFSFEAMEEYKRSLDLQRAIQEGQRLADIQKRKAEMKKARAEAEKKAAEAAVEIRTVDEAAKQEARAMKEPPREWIGFNVYVTYKEALELRAWLSDNGIEFRPIERR